MVIPRHPVLSLPLLLVLSILVVLSSTGSIIQHRSEATFTTEPRGLSWAETTLTSMSLEEKAAQLIMARTYGHYLSRESDEYERLVGLVEEHRIGGLVVFQGDVYETAVMLNDLQSRARIPLLVAADFERGVAMRIRRATYFPDAMAVGATRDVSFAYGIGKAIAEEARAIGIHQNLAPVADVNNNPANPVINTRSFGEDPELVAEMVAAFIRGTKDGGAIPTVKHFPGHGDTGLDSHLDLPVLPFSRARLDSVEFVSFKRAIASGVGSVMIAHLEVPSIETSSGLPASLSPATVSGVLRSEFGFDGLVVTDAMEMQGILKVRSIGESAVMALQAGVDIVLIPADEAVAADAIVRAVHHGELSEERLDQSVKRILDIKERLRLHEHRKVDLASVGDRVATDEHLLLAKEAARHAVTLVKNADNLLPLRPSGKQKLALITIGDSEESRTDVNRSANQLTNEPFGAYFANQFRQRAGWVEHFRLSPASNMMHFDSVLASASKKDLLVIALYAKVRSGSGKTGLPENLDTLVRKLSRVNKPAVVISFGNPYLIGLFPQGSSLVCAYSDAEIMVEAAVEGLFGETEFVGRLPVTIPGQFRFGDGVLLAQCVLRRDQPASVGFNGDSLRRVDTLILSAIRDSVFPGAQLAIIKDNVLVCNKSFGALTYAHEAPGVSGTTLFDLASITKVVATTTAVMRLYERGTIALDDPVSKFIPQLSAGEQSLITIRNLLEHRGGFPASLPLFRICASPASAMDSLYAARLVATPGDTTIYTDVGMMLLGKVVEKVSGISLDEFVRREFFGPLEMNNTMFNPAPSIRTRVAPTEWDATWRGRLIQGTVHDENADFLGGVAGHAGLFSNAANLAVFIQMILNGGTYGGTRYFRQSTVKEFTGRQAGDGPRALGWDLKSEQGSSAGTLFSSSSFGHTGYTGTSLWVDPERNLAVVFLTNRVHPTRSNNRIHGVRVALHDTIVRSIMPARDAIGLSRTQR
jgi:beta-glucosidase-like glycosyl hydrolase/CubicO group peptidase (beta-lactamase class C family)